MNIISNKYIILVTGCAGFIGSHVCEKLLKRGDTIVGIDNMNDYCLLSSCSVKCFRSDFELKLNVGYF